MTKSRQKLMSLVVAVMYAMCILVSAPVTAYAATGSHATAAYTKTQKNTATKTALAALAKLPANAAAAAKYTTSASLQKLVTAADKALATAKKMKLATTKFKNYGRLTVAKKAVATLVAAEKKAADAAAAVADKAAAEAVVAKIALIPATVTAADEATVNAAKTAFDALTVNGKKLVTNAATLTAAVAKIADLKGTFSVTSVKITSAKTFKVVFSKAVADTTKVKFEVKKVTTPLTTITATWNEAKTEAVLTSATVLAEAVYSVNVKNDTTDLGTTTVAVTPQKVAKITLLSTKLAVSSDGKTGYASYKVFDQYENDITTSYLAQNIKWSSVVVPTAKNGVLKLNDGTINFLTFQTVTITGYDSTNGVSGAATLTISAGTGTLSEIKIGAVDGIKLAADDLSSVFYLPYTAKDLAGNETTNYDLIEQGLYFTDKSAYELATSSYVTVKLVKDPADSKKAAIELKIKAQNPNPVTDLPVVFSVMTLNGVSSQVNTTLYRGAEVSTITIMSPAEVVAKDDDNVVIPFEAYDQAGKKVTKYSDIYDKVTFSTNLKVNKKVDGALELKIDKNALATKDATVFLTAVVKNTGKMSSVSLTVQDAKKADTLALDSSVLISAMEVGATQVIDFGDDMGGLSVRDQYDRDMDMLDGSTNDKYVVLAVASGSLVIDANTEYVKSGAAPDFGINEAVIRATGTANSSGTVTFTLFEDINGNGSYQANVDKVVDTRSTTISVIATADVKDFTMEGPKTPVYGYASGTLSDQAKEWYGKFIVYGKTSGGSKVKLNENKVQDPLYPLDPTKQLSTIVTGCSVSNPDEFVVSKCSGEFDGNRVTAKKLLDASKTSATTTVTVNILHNSEMFAVTGDLTSSTVTPKAVDAVLAYESGMLALGMKVDGDEITLKAGTFAGKTSIANANFVDGKYLTKFDENHMAAGRVAFYFRALDNYGKKAMDFSQIRLVSAVKTSTGVNLPAKLTVSNYGKLTFTTPAASDETYTFSAITNNGLVKTIKVICQ